MKTCSRTRYGSDWTAIYILRFDAIKHAAEVPKDAWHGQSKTRRITFLASWCVAARLTGTEFYGDMASAIGPIPANGGDFLRLLIEAKTIAASREPVGLRRIKLRELADQPHWGSIMRKVGWSAITSLCDR